MSSRIKRGIVIVGPTPPPYQGVSVSVGLLLQILTRAKIPFRHWDISDRRDLSSVDKIDWMNILLGLKHLLGYLFLIIWTHPQAVYLPLCQTKLGFIRDMAFLLPARILGKKRILHMHGSRFRSTYESCGPILKWLVRMAIGGNSHVLVLGEGLRSMFDGFIDPDRVHSIPNGIDGNGLVEHACERLEGTSSRSSKRILFFGTLTAAKGLHDALEACALVSRLHNDCEFTFAGGFRYPEDRTKAEEIVRKHALEGRVSFKGVTVGEQKTGLFATSDIFLFPSHDEGQPLVLLEAMAAGLPIVTTCVGTIPETVIDGQNGLIVPHKDPTAIAEALGTLLRDKELCGNMSRANIARFQEQYTLESLTNRLTQMLKTTLIGSA